MEKNSDNAYKFWASSLLNVPLVHGLLLDRPRYTSTRPVIHSYTSNIGGSRKQEIANVCTRYGCTVFAFMETVFSVLIHRYSNDNDIVLGTRVSLKDNKFLDGNTEASNSLIPLISQINPSQTFSSFLKQKIKTIDDSLSYGAWFNDFLLSEEIYNKNYGSIFGIQFNFVNNQNYEDYCDSCYDLDVSIEEKNNEMYVLWRFRGDLFNDETIWSMADSFRALIDSVIDDDNQSLQALSLLDELNKNKYLKILNRKNMPNNFENIYEVVEDASKLFGSKIAYQDEHSEYTYQQLISLVNSRALRLSQNGVEAGDIVGLYGCRSIDYFILMIALFKLKATYLPIDSNHGGEGFYDYIKASNPTWVIFVNEDEELISQAKEFNFSIWCFWSDTFLIKNILKKDIRNSSAYLIPTSGSSGKSKIVAGSAVGLVNRGVWSRECFSGGREALFAQIVSISHIDHLSEVVDCFCNGGTLVIMPSIGDSSLRKSIIEKKVDKITILPSRLESLINESFDFLFTLKTIVFSGEPLKRSLVSRILAINSALRVLNIYGCTEVSADVTFKEVNPNFGCVLNEFNLVQESRSKFSPKINSIHGRVTEPNVDLAQLKESFCNWEMPAEAISFEKYVSTLNENVIPYTVNVSSDKYVGHMTSALPHFLSDMVELIARLNQNMVKIETSKSLILLERQVIGWLHKEFFKRGYHFYENYGQDPAHVFGLVTSGGTLANITALHAARNTSFAISGFTNHSFTEVGAKSLLLQLGKVREVIICSAFAHYSIRKAAALMGIGTENIIKINCTSDLKMDIEELQQTISQCRENQWHIVAIVAVAGATETGIVDPLEQIACIAKENQIHFHVDAAWGGALVLSRTYSHLLNGIEKADTITFCGHKQLYLPQGISLCLFSNTSIAKDTAVHAQYQGREGSFDVGQYSIEGSRGANILLLHAALHVISRNGYAWLIDRSVVLSKRIAEFIQSNASFQLIGHPEMNIINYRYIPAQYRRKENLSFEENDAISAGLEKIQALQFDRGNTFVSKTRAKIPGVCDQEISFFRMVISNPNTSFDSVQIVLAEQLEIAQEVFVDPLGRDPVNNYDALASAPPALHADPIFESVGTPIRNTQIYVLDSVGQLVPPNVVGEIVVMGDSVSQGYYKDPESTKKFYVSELFTGLSKAYFTSDLGRYRFDGSIEILGRKGDEVKIAGYRIYASEIENMVEQLLCVHTCKLEMSANSGAQPTLFIKIVEMADESSSLENINVLIEDKFGSGFKPKIIFINDFLKTPSGKVKKSYESA